MHKVNKKMKILVIVESPSKCKKIQKFLNDHDSVNIYEVVATMGHITELNSLQNIDIANGFRCRYTLVDSKAKQIETLRKKVRESNEVLVATDDDREGESIGYHVCTTFGLDVESTKRIVFHEITESAIIKALHLPRFIDMNKVKAQQARQIMDLLVGFQLSPQLWKHILKNKENPLSAGRCQSPALRLIYDNEKDIENSPPVQVYNLNGHFFSQNISFQLDYKYETAEEIENFLVEAINFDHVFSLGPVSKSTRKQPEPFTTSKLQQAASNEFSYSPKDTMKACQHLYEAGFITYMRTDSKLYSMEFTESVKKYIERNLDVSKYLVPELLDSLTLSSDKNEEEKEPPKKKAKKVVEEVKPQEAHEAIRPTDIFVLAAEDESFGPKERKMYQLIWRNTLESCLPPALFSCVKASLSAFDSRHFVYSSERLDFPGFKIVKPSASDTDPHFNFLLNARQNVVVPFSKMTATVSLKGQKLHHTEAHLVHLLEEQGIGRPSTFSSLVDKIQEKQYVVKQDLPGKKIRCLEYVLDSEGSLEESNIEKEVGKEKGKLFITPLGKIVSEFLHQHFQPLINYEFTKQMEDSLDQIVKRETDLATLCQSCNLLINQCLEPLGINTNTALTTSSKKEALGTFEDLPVFLKNGKFGFYAQWGEKTRNLKEFSKLAMEEVTWDKVLPLLEEGTPILREINKDVSIRRGPKGNYIFYKPPKAKKPMFLSLSGFENDFTSCNIEIIKSWIREKHNIHFA